jgi:hypothetical protein
MDSKNESLKAIAGAVTGRGKTSEGTPSYGIDG